jgi:Fe-S-cluster-containing hydrogenase component 2
VKRRFFLAALAGTAAGAAFTSAPLAQEPEKHKSIIVRAKCVGCGDCIRACPMKAISYDCGKARVDQEKCIACKLCVLTCSYGAPR